MSVSVSCERERVWCVRDVCVCLVGVVCERELV